MSIDQVGAGQRPAPWFPGEQTGWDSREAWKPVLTEAGVTPEEGGLSWWSLQCRGAALPGGQGFAAL